MQTNKFLDFQVEKKNRNFFSPIKTSSKRNNELIINQKYGKPNALLPILRLKDKGKIKIDSRANIMNSLGENPLIKKLSVFEEIS